jgi:hypothetical protein
MKRSMFLLFLFLFSSICYADVTTGLVGWWKLDDGAGAVTLDSSGNANTGTLGNAPTWVAGHIGSHALTFNGTSQYSTSAATNIPTIQGNLTYSAWINYTATGASRDIVVGEINGTSANQMRINTAGDAEVSDWGGGIILTETSLAVSINTWHMITFTWNGTTNILYVDGVATTPTSATAHQTGTTTAVLLAAYGTGGGNENFNGTIDDARIYNRALTAADVAQLFTFTGRNGLFTLIDR